jgi:hypothetical protein
VPDGVGGASEGRLRSIEGFFFEVLFEINAFMEDAGDLHGIVAQAVNRSPGGLFGSCGDQRSCGGQCWMSLRVFSVPFSGKRKSSGFALRSGINCRLRIDE